MDDVLFDVFKAQVIIQSHYFLTAWREFAITIFEGDDPKIAGAAA